MSSVKMVAKLPDDDTTANGLDRHASHFLTRPYDQVVVVAYVSTAKLVASYGGDTLGNTPYVGIDAVEVIGTAVDLGSTSPVVTAFEAARARRLDRDPNLFDASEEEAPDTTEPDQLALTDGVDVDAALHQVNQVLSDVVEAEIVETCSYCGHDLSNHQPGDGPCLVSECDCVEAYR